MLAFGTSGLRGLVTEMTDRECYLSTRGFLRTLADTGKLPEGGPVALAGDLRSSTPRILRAVTRAVADAGCRPIPCGMIPTPAVAWYGLEHGCPAIMVTGSHIPDDRNGIKFFTARGEILKNDEAPILAAVAAVRQDPEIRRRFTEAGEFRAPDRPGESVDATAARRYVKRYLEFFPRSILAGRRIVLDEHSSVGRDLLAEILQGLGAEVVALNRSDAFVAKDTENVSDDDLARYRAWAGAHSPFAMVSMDGDSDRPLLLDEQGRWYPGDILGAVVARWLQARVAVVPVSANDAVDTYLGARGLRVQRTRIGSPYVIAAMQAAVESGEDQVVGWESNGGFLSATDFIRQERRLGALPTRDAVLPLLCSLTAGVEHGSLSALFADLPPRFARSGLLDGINPAASRRLMDALTPDRNDCISVSFEQGRMKCDDSSGRNIASVPRPEGTSLPDRHATAYPFVIKQKLETRYFQASAGFAPIRGFNFLDGVRVLFSNQDVIHLRPSGNAPQMRVYVLANSQARADELVKQMLSEEGILQKMLHAEEYL